MRKIVLVRAGKPDLPAGERWCLGRTDVPLGVLGRLQAQTLRHVPELKEIRSVFSSPLRRARETAQAFTEDYTVVEDLRERDMGLWDGHCFSEIRRRWPELYEVRKHWPDILPEGAESMVETRSRMRKAVSECMNRCEGDLMIISHRSAIASLAGGRLPIDYTSVTVLEVEDGRLETLETGRRYRPELTDALCRDLMTASGTGRVMEEHGEAVADLADRFVRALKEHGAVLHQSEIRQACLLHDIARHHNDHASCGAGWLRELGYPEVAELIRQHHLPDQPGIHDAAVVFMADKCVSGNKAVGMEKRLRESERNRPSVAARTEHQEKWKMAEVLSNQMNFLCRKRIVP